MNASVVAAGRAAAHSSGASRAGHMAWPQSVNGAGKPVKLFGLLLASHCP
jgi:hypothetical protein